MITVFHDNKIWDCYDDPAKAKKENIPLYAIAHSSEYNSWWCWYHSWCRIYEDDPRIDDWPVCQICRLVTS